MRVANMAALVVAAALPGCQASLPDQQALSQPSAVLTTCPAPGSEIQLLRASTGLPVGTLTYVRGAGPAEDGMCVARSSANRRTVMNIAGRSIHPDARREHARMQSELGGLRPGATATGFVNMTESAGQRSVQVQVTYMVLREERVAVPAGTFDTIVVEEVERNGSCMSNWTAWLDKETHLPVKVHNELLQCLQVRQSDTVAGKLTRL